MAFPDQVQGVLGRLGNLKGITPSQHSLSDLREDGSLLQFQQVIDQPGVFIDFVHLSSL